MGQLESLSVLEMGFVWLEGFSSFIKEGGFDLLLENTDRSHCLK